MEEKSLVHSDEPERATRQSNALPASFEEIKGMAQAFVQSGMFQDTKQLSQAIVKIQAGRELGLPPVYSMQNINLIRSRLTSNANTMAMLVKRSDRYNYRIKEHTDDVCSITFYERDGAKWAEAGTSTFTMADAKRADLVKPDSGWAKYPRAMLFSRAISQGARIYCPDAIGGIYTDEEIRTIPPRPSKDETKTTATIPPLQSDLDEFSEVQKTEPPVASGGEPEKTDTVASPTGNPATEKLGINMIELVELATKNRMTLVDLTKYCTGTFKVVLKLAKNLDGLVAQLTQENREALVKYLRERAEVS